VETIAFFSIPSGTPIDHPRGQRVQIRRYGKAFLGVSSLLLACGSSDSSGSAPPPGQGGGTETEAGTIVVAPPQGIVGRVGVSGPAAQAAVTAYAATGGALLGLATVGADGVFGIDLKGFVGDVRLETSLGTYQDPVSGETKPLPRLRSIVPSSDATRPTCFAQLTPLTELVSALMDEGFEQDLALTNVGLLAGGENVLCTKPADPTAAPDPNEREGTESGVAIGGVATLAAAKGTDLAQTVRDLAASLKTRDTAAGAAYIKAVEDFTVSAANKSGLTATSSLAAIPSVNPWEFVATPLPYIDIARCGKTYPKNPAFDYGGTLTIDCTPPAVKGAGTVIDGPGPHPAGSFCGRTLSCANDELHACSGNWCHAAIVPPPTPRKVWRTCEWYTKTPEASSGCPGGAGIPRDPVLRVPRPHCTGSGAETTCQPELTIVLPFDHDIDGTVMVQVDGKLHTLFQAPGPGVRRVFPPDACDSGQTCQKNDTCTGGGRACKYERCPGRDDQGCVHVAAFLSTIGEGTASVAATLLTTYGKQWSVSFTYPRTANARTYCDAYSGECVTYTTPGGGGGGATCESLCAQIAASCGPDDKCIRECTDDSAEAAAKGLAAEYAAMMQCCDGKDFAPYCASDGFDPCQTGSSDVGACKRPW
jgi:hypothetical protein